MDKRVNMSHDAASQMTEMNRYTFDDAERLTKLVYTRDGNILSTYEWAYDRADRIT